MDHQEDCGAEGQGEKTLAGVGRRGGISVTDDREEGVTQPEDGVEEDQEQGDFFGIWVFGTSIDL